jgi:hypothetical protein
VLRRLALAVMIALVPTVASAQEELVLKGPAPDPSSRTDRRDFRGGPVRGGPVVGPQGHLFSYRGRTIERIDQ